jgi:hypothetical protein
MCRVTARQLALDLPDIPTVRRRSQALAILDAILCPEWAYRYFSFDSRWGPGEEMASMRNGSGDEYSIGFSAAGAFVRGFDHESSMSPYSHDDRRLWPGLVDSVPQEFERWLNEPAFGSQGFLEATVCLWRGPADDHWHTGDVDEPRDADPGWVFEELVDLSGAAFRTYAEEVHEVELSPADVAHVFALRPLTEELVRRLNPEVGLADLREDLAGIGCPTPVDETAGR